MSEHQEIETMQATEGTPDAGRRRPTASQIAAAVEAAYILEAVRK